MGLKPRKSARPRLEKPETVLILRTCSKDLKSRGGFQWPESGPVEAPDWDSEPKCGYGLHGFVRGVGDDWLADWSSNAKWLVIEAAKSEIVDLGGKVKFPRGTVIYSGDRETATKIVKERYPDVPVIGCTATAGDWGTATAGGCGKATAGYRGTATAGDEGTATAGGCGKATAGYRGTATAGDYGKATVGNRGTATASRKGTATAGDEGAATAGYGGTATAGYKGAATAGVGGEIRIRWYDGNRFRLAVGYVGEDGIEPNVPYVVRDGKLTKKE